MPELPEVETVCRGLAPAMEGAWIQAVELRRPDLRHPFPEKFVQKITGRRVISVRRRAKYVIVELDGTDVLIMHMGMSGSFRIEMDADFCVPGIFYYPRRTDRLHDHVVFNLMHDGGSLRIIYNDPRRFGSMNLVRRDQLDNCRQLRFLGLEPTGNALNGKYVSQCFAGRAAPLKSVLLDQRLIAGLGNIYVCEALWRSGLSPKRKACTIAGKEGAATKQSNRLAQDIRDVITEAINAGGASLRDHRRTNGEMGYFQHAFRVYNQAGSSCTREGCGGVVHKIVQSGRSTFYCPICQK